jgi:hypothetical protein
MAESTPWISYLREHARDTFGPAGAVLDDIADDIEADVARIAELEAALHPEPLQGRCECGRCIHGWAGWCDWKRSANVADGAHCSECGCLLDSGGVAHPRPKAPEEAK